MHLIWKFPISKPPEKSIIGVKVPMDATPLYFGDDGTGQICLWVETSEGSAREFTQSDNHKVLRYAIVKTGEPFPISLHDQYITTIVTGIMLPLVWHVYRLGE